MFTEGKSRVFPLTEKQEEPSASGPSEQAELLNKACNTQHIRDKHLRTAAIIVSWISAVISLAQGVVATVIALEEHSGALFGFGLDAMLDSASSVVVLWRFYGKDQYSEDREVRACLIIGILFVLSSVILAGKTIHALIVELKENRVHLLSVISLSNGIFNLIMGITKLSIGCKIPSKSLVTDSVITLTGSVMSLAAFLAFELYVHNGSLWYIDSVFGIGCSIFLLLYSIKLFVDTYKKKKEGLT